MSTTAGSRNGTTSRNGELTPHSPPASFFDGALHPPRPGSNQGLLLLSLGESRSIRRAIVSRPPSLRFDKRLAYRRQLPHQLEAWEPYESHGTFKFEGTTPLGPMVVECAESGSGTIGSRRDDDLLRVHHDDQIGRSNEKIHGLHTKEVTSIALDGTFRSKTEPLTTVVLPEGCALEGTYKVAAGSGLVPQSGRRGC